MKQPQHVDSWQPVRSMANFQFERCEDSARIRTMVDDDPVCHEPGGATVQSISQQPISFAGRVGMQDLQAKPCLMAILRILNDGGTDRT